MGAREIEVAEWVLLWAEDNARYQVAILQVDVLQHHIAYGDQRLGGAFVDEREEKRAAGAFGSCVVAVTGASRASANQAAAAVAVQSRWASTACSSRECSCSEYSL